MRRRDAACRRPDGGGVRSAAMSTRSALAAVVLLGAALTAGCNRGPAREALAEAEQAIEAGRPQLEAYAPQELAGLRSTVKDARARLDEGRYTDALRLVQGLPSRLQDALDKGNRRKSELEAEWAALSGRLPLVLRGLGLKLDELAAKPPPRGPDPDPLVAARARLVELDRSWSQAASAFAGGRSAPAVAAAREVAAAADALAVRLGLTPDAAVARANAASAAAASSAAAAAAAGPPPAPRP